MSLKLDIKTALTIGGILVSLAGFYYQTQMRLSDLESEVTSLKKADKQTRKLIRRSHAKSE